MRKPFLHEGLPDFVRQNTEGQIVHTYHFELLTPMMGGDSTSWVLHPTEPVRGQSVKGQLRFWWRTMQSETNPKRLLQMENEIWGGKIGDEERIQSRVKIAILDQCIKKSSQAELNEKGFTIEGNVIPVYVAFPITSAIKNDKKDVRFVESLSFSLQISCPKEHWKILQKTLKLWVLFGGVGARIRRGCGSLYCEELMKDFTDANAISAFIRSFNNNGDKLPYPRLDGSVLATAEAGTDPAAAWRNLITAYAGFRQDRRPGRPTPGRSYWPEPDAIRIITGQKAPNHAPEHPDGVWFPRAAFGLPIITKFNTKNNGVGDPDPQVELVPQGFTRWPSPVILKAIRLPNGMTVKTALVLNQAFPEKLTLKQKIMEKDVPVTAHPFAPPLGSKYMKTSQEGALQTDETLYQALFRKLELMEAI